MRRMVAVLGATAATLAPIAAAQAGASARAADAVSCDARKLPVRVLGAFREVGATYCRPAAANARAAFVLVPGATYNRAYWDFPYRPETYSFARALARSGYAALAVDRLGTGESWKPLSAIVTASSEADAIRDVIERLRSTGIDGTRFETVLLAGHSLGSMISIVEAATFGNVDGVVITGLLHRFDPTALATILGRLHPALLDPAFAGAGLDPGYLTTVPGERYGAFHAPGEVDPGVVAADEETKDVFSATEAPDGAGLGVVTPYSALIDVPVLLGIGGSDTLFCAPIGSDCSSREALLAQERPQYAGAPCLDVALTGVGHDVNLHPSAPELQAKIVNWANVVTSGGCPQGP